VGTSAQEVKKYLEEKSKITSLLADPALKLNQWLINARTKE
jgi:hypothetical protein